MSAREGGHLFCADHLVSATTAVERKTQGTSELAWKSPQPLSFGGRADLVGWHFYILARGLYPQWSFVSTLEPRVDASMLSRF